MNELEDKKEEVEGEVITPPEKAKNLDELSKSLDNIPTVLVQGEPTSINYDDDARYVFFYLNDLTVEKQKELLYYFPEMPANKPIMVIDRETFTGNIVDEMYEDDDDDDEEMYGTRHNYYYDY